MTRPGRLIVVGSSAGGIDALSTLVGVLPDDLGAPVVLAQHIDPERESHLGEILARRSTLPVVEVTGGESLAPGTVYVVPADRHVEIVDGAIRLSATGEDHVSTPSIDLLLTSAAASYGEDLVAVILSGSGSDGTVGARAVKAAGGTVIIQDPGTAQYPSMPSSLAPNTVDIVADIDRMGELFTELASEARSGGAAATEEIDALLARIRDRSGIDFRAYKRPTIERRLQRRVVATGSATLRDYVEFLEATPEEYDRLVASFLVKVTEFFRDEDLFAHLRDVVVPELVAFAAANGRRLRVWSAGCATGEEAYSIAILVAEALGDELGSYDVRIFATDLDEQAIDFARRGVYPAASVAALDPELVGRYFAPTGADYTVSPELRLLMVFGQHDLGARAPFPRIDLTLCRNVLIYFTQELQRRALQLFAFSLRENGYLVLGKAESTSVLNESFVPADGRLRVYRRQGPRVLIPPVRARHDGGSTAGPGGGDARWAGTTAARRAVPRPAANDGGHQALTQLPVGVVTIDRRYDIRFINVVARRVLGIHGEVVGEDLVHVARRIGADALRELIDRALRDGGASARLALRNDDARSDGMRWVRAMASPLVSRSDAEPALVLTLEDVTDAEQERSRLEAEAETARRELDRLQEQIRKQADTNTDLVTANRDLYATTSDLRSSNDELLVANEEAQAATEEVETLNEELQATNEELETLNEELQATIEELNTTNDDLEARTIELQDTAARLESARAASETERARLAAILESMGDAVVVVDRQARPLLANDAYTRLVGPASHTTMDDEQGRPIRGAASLEARAARGEEFETVVTRATKAGGRRWYEAVSCRVQSVTVPESTLLVVRDITDRSLRRLQDEFIANASHELRTPLAVLTGYLHLIDRAATDGVAGHVRRALDHARELDHLVGDLLDITRLETGRLRYEPEPVDLADLVHQAVDAAVVVASEQRIGFRRPARPLIVDADRTRLLQVVRNLLDNARVHAPGAEVRVALRRRSGRAELSVSDDGPGIAANEASKVFERFQQVGAGQSSQPGLGLGLHIAREIVRAHKGTINVTSPDGGGTVFTVRLPLLGERKSRPTGPKPPSRVHA